MEFYEAVGKKYDLELKQRVLSFPATEPCPQCKAPRQVGLSDGSQVDDPRLALQIRLVEFGYSGDFKDLSKPEPQPCCRLGDISPASVRSALRRYEDGKWGFPTICVCSGCGGYSALVGGPEDPGLAWRVALVQFGAIMCRHYDNDPPARTCDCETRLAMLDRHVAELPLVQDSGWKTTGGLPHRGITDFGRTMRFARDLTPEETDLLREWLQRKDCPGWTGIRMRNCGDGEYGFTTTWDSSD